MVALASVTPAAPFPKPKLQAESGRFDRRLEKILQHATEVFCEKGYAGASMRDLSRASAMSLAGLYHYVGSKERMLYLIQKHTFSTILRRLKEKLEDVDDPNERVRVLIKNHLEYFLANKEAMKVLSHEDDVLTGKYGAEIAEIKREYYRTCVELLNTFKRARGAEFISRIAVLSLFGMMNWIYTWYNPRADVDAKQLAEEMGDLFLRGISGTKHKNGKK
jgi:AcrR family transcriptional regulator